MSRNKRISKKELSFGNPDPSVIINHYPKPGQGVLVSQDRVNFDPDVKKYCSRERSSVEEESKAEKIILVGNHSVGKTCLVRRYCEDDYTDGYKATIGVDFMFRQYNILGRDFTLHIWDTAGQEQFKCVSKAYFRGAMAVLVAFDLGDPQSLKDAKDWLDDVASENSDDMIRFLVGNKSDVFHVVSPEMALDAANLMKAEYWETSSKQNTNVKELFERLAVSLFEASILRLTKANSKGSTKTEIGSHVFLGDGGSASSTNSNRKCCNL